MLAGELYRVTDPELAAMHDRALDLLREFNSAAQADRREEVLRSLFGQVGASPSITPTFYCDCDSNTYTGDNLYMKFRLRDSRLQRSSHRGQPSVQSLGANLHSHPSARSDRAIDRGVNH